MLGWSNAAALEHALTTTFSEIADTRMRGIPIVHPDLHVEAVGFRAAAGGWLGVLITPWCMNLMLFPDASGTLPEVEPSREVCVTLPSGDLPFMAGEEAGLGRYLMCSLFSPMEMFSDQASAHATACAVLDALFPPPEPAPVAAEVDLSRRRLFGLRT